MLQSLAQPAPRFVHWARVIEAVVLLVAARIYVAAVPYRTWPNHLGQRSSKFEPQKRPMATEPIDRHVAPLVHAVNRATARLPVAMICLPRAIALQWMLARRGKVSSDLVVGIESGKSAGKRDLHAWVEVAGQCVLGMDEHREYSPSVRFRSG